MMLIVSGILMSGCSKERAGEDDRRSPDARPSEWAYLQRTFPTGHFNREAYREAYAAAAEVERLSKAGRALGRWELAGPTNVGGRISDVEFDPSDPIVVYASAATGGVFKSTDKGETWSPIFDGYAVLNVGDIGVAPSQPSTLYIGTGEANGGANNLQGAGVFKSDDGGGTWTNVGLEETAAIGRIVVHPENPDLVYVAAVGSYFDVGPNRGVYRTRDGGDTWEKVLFVSDTTGAIDLVMNPENPDILYAAMWYRWRHPTEAELAGHSSGIYRTVDGGDSWQELGPATGLPDPDIESVGRIGLAISASDPDILYAVYTGKEGPNHVFKAIYKTIDGGDTWTDFDPDGSVAHQFGGGFSWWFGQVRVSPVDPDRVYVMEVEFVHTRDAGQTWLVRIGGRNNLHVDHHALAFDPQNPDYLIVGNDGGLNISEDGGLTFRKVRGLPITQFYEIEIDEKDPSQLYGGTQDNETLTTPTGALDDWVPLELPAGTGAGGDGFYVKVTYEPAGYRAVYAESQFGNLYKAFAGDEFRSISPYQAAGDRRNWSTPYVISPSTVAVLYYGTHSVYKSETRGSIWTRISPKLTSDWPTAPGFGTITTIDVAPSFPQAIVVGTDEGKIWTSPDDGANWVDASEGLPGRWVTRVAFDPRDASVIYATFSGLKWRDPLPHVYRSQDFGTSWTDISGNLPDAPVNALAVDPVNPDVILIGSDVGAFAHFNRGEPSSPWESLGEGLPTVAVYDLKINAQPHFAVVGTHGRSMYKLDLSGIVTAVESGGPAAGSLPATFAVEGNYPNPFSTATVIRFSGPVGTELSVGVFDLSGRAVATPFSGSTRTGLMEVGWDGTASTGEHVSSGTYLFRITTADGRIVGSGTMSLVR